MNAKAKTKAEPAPGAPATIVTELLIKASWKIAAGFAETSADKFLEADKIGEDSSAIFRNAFGALKKVKDANRLAMPLDEYRYIRTAWIKRIVLKGKKTDLAAEKDFERAMFLAYDQTLSKTVPLAVTPKAVSVATTRAAKTAAIELVAKSDESNKALESAAKKAAKAVTDLKVKAIKADKADKPELQKQVAIMENIAKVNEAAIVARLKAEQTKLVDQCRELKATINEHIATAVKAGDIDRLKKMAAI